ncbi:MAG: hypothetical protein HY619_05055 [Thaumarchaeota archaeon]|nr:hypothetical protein [Nitrososphaerota archaeon]
MHELKDSEFLTAKEKAIVLKQWKRFIENGLRFEDFTERLYKHLHLHCSFIAHFSRGGFYATYFENPEHTIRFLHQFDTGFGCKSIEYGGQWWIQGDYADINKAMCDTIDSYKADLYVKLSAKARENDIEKARSLLAKHGLSIATG